MTGCEKLVNGICGECTYCEGLLVTRPLDSITSAEWIEIRKRFRYVNGAKPMLSLIRSP